jgi:hypothetical protein
MTVTSRTQLSQGAVKAVADLAFNTGVGADIGLDSATNDMPALAVGEFFEVRNHPLATNNGLYVIVTVNTSTTSYEADKVSGAAPVVDTAEAVSMLGATGASTEKSVMLDTAGLGVYLLEKGNLDSTGANGDAVYSFFMQEFKDDDFVRANAPFPMNAIDKDAGKYIMGQDSSGNSNGWNWVDVPAESIRTRKLLRNMGWDEVSSAGVILNRHASIVTLGTFEAPTTDVAFYQFGTNTVVDDTNDFDFAGPVNEAVQFFERLADGAVNGGTGVAIDTTGRLLTRSDGGNWRTDGFIVGGRVQVRDAEDSTADGTWLLADVGTGVDGALTCGRAADTTAGLVFTDGGGGNDQLTLPSGGFTWAQYGWTVGAKIVITSAEDVGNDGIYTILAIDGFTADVATASFTANADDTTAVLGPFDDALTPDIAINVAIDNDNAFRLGIRVRDGDPNGKTFGESNLAGAGKTALGNFVFAFPLANATDLKISATDATITGSLPYTGMSITFHSTPQARAGLVGGSFNFGIIVDGNDGTGIEVFEFIQHQLRLLTDIDTDADTAIGRSIGLLARFNGDEFQVGSGDGGLSFPVNPDGGGSGVYVDNLNATSANDVIFYDNTGTPRSNPETIPVTFDFNDIVTINDATSEFSGYFDRTIRTNVTDLVITAGAPATITSAGTQLPDNAELAVGSYVRISGLTAGDAPMNGVYQVITETTPGAAWDVVRYDGAAIVTVTTATADLDQNCIDTPDAIIINTNVGLTATTISFTAPDTMGDTGNGLGIFAIGDRVRIEGTASNNGIREVLTVAVGTITFVEQDITTEAAGASMTVTKVASGDADADFVFSFDFDNNTQGGRVGGSSTSIKAKAIGSTDAQYIQSAVSLIVSGTPLTVPLFAATERNYT